MPAPLSLAYKSKVFRGCDLTRGLLTSVTHTFGQRRAQAQHPINGLLVILGVGDVIDQRRPHHHTIGQTRNRRGLVRGADAKADTDRQVGMTTQAGDGFFDMFEGGGSRTCFSCD